MVARRHSLIYLLFFAVAGVLALLGPGETHSAPAPEDEHTIPTEALTALQEGRYLRASLVLRDYLATQADTSAAAIMLAARAEAGWGDWQRVRELLEGRSWLDRVASGHGWHLLGRSQLELGDWRQSSISLGRFLGMSEDEAGSPAQGLVLLRRARALVEQREFAEGVEAFDRAAHLLPVVADWIEVFAASAAAAMGDTAGVRQRLARVDQHLATEWAWRADVRARRNARDVSGALAAAERAAARLEGEGRRAAAWSLVGQIRQERGDLLNARLAYVQAMETAPGSVGAVEAARAISAMSAVPPDAQLLAARVFLRHGNSARGVAGLKAYLDGGWGTAAERARLLYDMADAHFRVGQYGAAETALLQVAASSADSEVAADALFTAARAQYRDGRSDLARTTMARVIHEWPDQPAAARAAYLLADLDHDDHNFDTAAGLYRQVVRMAPGGTEAAFARMRLGGIAFARHRYGDALVEFEQYRASHPTGRAYQQATYWTAQALGRLGRTEEKRRRLNEVRNIDPFSYYGGLAAEELGESIADRRLEPSPPHNERYDTQVRRALARVDLLRQIGWDDAANFEMERVRRHFAQFDGALYALAELLNERGFTSAGVTLGRDIHRREGAWNLRLLRIVYPMPFRNIILAEARERNVDPFLVAALIRQESMFNPAARSPAGALGLMQVMPQTGTALARKLGIARFNPAMLSQPELNVAFGTAYLAEQLRTYGHRTDAVLAAYNAGPGRVRRWQQFPEWREGALFAERIPFDETRDYVRIVQNNRRIYAAIYGDIMDTSPAP
jgi:soluble lytic murein transglycosylase